jgi:hypothetical protein
MPLDYVNEVYSDSPYLWWRLNEGAGPTAADSSSNWREGTYFGTDRTHGLFGINSEDVWSRAVRFNQSGSTYDAGVIYNPVEAGFPTTEFSIEFVIRDITFGIGRTLVSYAQPGNFDEIRLVFPNTTGLMQVHVAGASANAQAFMYRETLANSHQVVDWRSSDGRLRRWINGVLVSTGTLSVGASIVGGGSLVLCQDQDSVGGGYVTADAFRCTLCDFAIYNTILPDARIRAHANAALVQYIDYEMLPGVTMGVDYSADDVVPFTTDGSAAPATTYLQRVWDTTLQAWCYYRKTTIDPAPLSGETVPNHTGSITAHSVVRVE